MDKIGAITRKFDNVEPHRRSVDVAALEEFWDYICTLRELAAFREFTPLCILNADETRWAVENQEATLAIRMKCFRGQGARSQGTTKSATEAESGLTVTPCVSPIYGLVAMDVIALEKAPPDVVQALREAIPEKLRPFTRVVQTATGYQTIKSSFDLFYNHVVPALRLREQNKEPSQDAIRRFMDVATANSNNHVTLQHKYMLLLDGSSTHNFSITDFNQLAMCGLHVVFLPANSTHVMQPLDRAPFRVFKMLARKLLGQVRPPSCAVRGHCHVRWLLTSACQAYELDLFARTGVGGALDDARWEVARTRLLALTLPQSVTNILCRSLAPGAQTPVLVVAYTSLTRALTDCDIRFVSVISSPSARCRGTCRHRRP